MNRLASSFISHLLAFTLGSGVGPGLQLNNVRQIESQAAISIVELPSFDEYEPKINYAYSTAPFQYFRHDELIPMPNSFPLYKAPIPTYSVPAAHIALLESIPDSVASIVDVPAQKLIVYKKSNTGWNETGEYECSTAKDTFPKERSGDNRTPEGILRISEVQNSKDWTFFDTETGDTLKYGNYFCRSEDTLDGRHFKGIGIHGTNREDILGTPASHGCIRLQNNTLETLVDDGILKQGRFVGVSFDRNIYKELEALYVPSHSNAGYSIAIGDISNGQNRKVYKR
ncbi:MAG: L,D-transpeptidase [Candidatus Woesearchaeota archaeon]